MAEIRTSRGKVVTIGQTKVPKAPPIGCEIPTLYFVVIKKDDGGYVSSCIQLLIDGYGATESKAIDDMAGNIGYFLYESFKNPECREDAWENIIELAKSTPLSDPLWEAYRMFQLELAKNGQATDRYSTLYDKICALHDEVRNLELKLHPLQIMTVI